VRVAFHAINGVGLGHVVRTLCLAAEMPALVPGIQLLVVTNARDTSLLARAGIDHVQLPPRLFEPHADPARVHAALPEPLEEAALVATFRAFRPDLVVFDTHAPMRVVRALTAMGVRSVLVLRELRPEALQALVASRALLAFDRVVVPHDASEVDAAGFGDAVVELVGPISRPVAPAAAPSPHPLVVAIAGGGGQPVDARGYLRAVADAHLLARARVPDLETILVTGPYAEPPRHLDRFAGITAIASTPELPELLARATLVVSQAGYNAIAEIRALAKPAVLVPGYRKAEDQRARARRLVDIGAARLARPEARKLATAIERALLTPGALDAMRAAHATMPLVARNRDAAAAVLRPIARGRDVRRVVLVAHDYAPKLGGMETVARGLAGGLHARGIDVRVYTTNRLGAAAPGVRALFRPLPRPRRIDLQADLHATIDAALRDAPDVIHLCHAGLGPWIPALRAALPCAITANVHGNDLLAPWVHHGTTDDGYRAAQIAGLSAADAVVCVSAFSRALARGRGVADDVLHAVENGVDTARFCPGPRDAALARQLGVADGDEVVLAVSRLAPRKGHRTALHAIARLAATRPRLRFVFTGASDAMRAELGALARELGIRDRVIAAGFVPDDELPALYRLADAFVLLADAATDDDVEGFGVALVEAAASALPVVAASTGGIPEAVGDAGVLVPPGDADAAAAAIARVLDAPGDLGARARARVVASLAQDRVTARMVALWTDVLGRGPRRPDPAGVEIVRDAVQRAAARRAERDRRRDTLARVIARDRLVRLRAIGDGDRLLPDALADCAALDHAPRVEVKLKRFVEADFQVHALPHVEGVDLVHGVPAPSAAALLAAVRALSLGRVRTVRMFLVADADPIAAVPEAHALRALFAARGTTVVPPPELMRYLSTTPAGGPETAMIEPTNLCNLACPTCPTGTGKIAPLPAMSLDGFEHALGALTPRLRNLALWNYGEPLLNKQLPDMIARAKQAGVGVVKVSSNVHFLDAARGGALLDSGLDVLILSVDGASQATYETFRKDGDFATVAAAVAWLCAEKQRRGLAKPRIELQFIAMRHNEHELPEMRRLAREWGVDRLRIKTVGADDDHTKHLVPASRLLSRYAADQATPNVRHPFCTMAWDHTVINVDGSVTPCCYLRPDMGDAFVMGNVFDAPFAAIWRGEKYRAFRAAMLAGRDDLPVCNKCRGGTHDLIAAIEEVHA
jgi:radical SAM protein with 4Fe4S-binding SPASM domain